MADGAPVRAEVEWSAAGPRVRLPDFEGVPNTSLMHPEEPPYRYSLQLAGDANPLYVLHDMRQTELRWPTYEVDVADAAGDGASVRAPIVGRVAKVFVQGRRHRGQGRPHRRGRGHEDGARAARPARRHGGERGRQGGRAGGAGRGGGGAERVGKRGTSRSDAKA